MTLALSVGDVRVTAVVESDQAFPTALFLPDVTTEVVDRSPWLVPTHVDEGGNVRLRFQSFVVEADGLLIVVDTCVGNDKPRGLAIFDRLATPFLEHFEAAGFGLHDVDIVLCTHLHIDHVGWNTRLVDGRWVPTFPNARYLIGSTEYAHWNAHGDEEQQAVLADSVAPVFDAGLAQFVESDHRLCASVALTPTPGHTPGHHSVRITSSDEVAVITGDLLHHAVQVAHPDFCSVADDDPPRARQTRRAFLATCADTGAVMIGTHFPGSTAYRVSRSGGVDEFVLGELE